MSHTTRHLALMAALLSGLPAAAAAQDINQDNTAYGTTSAEFLLFGAGARGTALGGAFSAMASDVSSMYYNPAGLALIPRAGAMIGTYDYVAETRYSWGGLAFPFSGGLSIARDAKSQSGPSSRMPVRSLFADSFHSVPKNRS